MLCVQPHGAIFENNQVKGFVKPPVKETTCQFIRDWTETWSVGFVCPTCRSTFREAETWRNCPKTSRGCWYRSAAPCRPGLRRRPPSQWHPETACSYRGWSRCHERWPTGSCRISNHISKWWKKLFHPRQNVDWLSSATYLSPAVSAASLSSPGSGSDWSARILSICCSISRGSSSRPS